MDECKEERTFVKLTVVGYWHAYPKANEATSGFLLEKDGFSLLIDCGSGVVSQLQNYCQLEQLDAVILSHYHQDHMADIGVLQYAIMMNTYAGKITKALPIYGHKLDEAKFHSLTYEPFVKGMEYRPDETLEIGPFSINFLQTNHPAPCFAMQITDHKHVLVYTADTDMFDELPAFIRDCDLLITECSFFANQKKAGGHLSSKDVSHLARLTQPKHVLLSHLPHFGSHKQLLEEVQNEYKGNVELAATGWTKSFN